MARYPPDVPENAEAETVLHYAPRTRAFTALWLLEELNLLPLMSPAHIMPAQNDSTFPYMFIYGSVEIFNSDNGEDVCDMRFRVDFENFGTFGNPALIPNTNFS